MSQFQPHKSTDYVMRYNYDTTAAQPNSCVCSGYDIGNEMNSQEKFRNRTVMVLGLVTEAVQG